MGGAYLSRPVTAKISETGRNSRVSYGVSSMQGWRMKQEDAHTCMVDFDEDASLFGVYDGHGGFEVAKYTSDNFPTFLRNNEKYKAQNYEEALIEAFLDFDDTIPTPEVIAVLKEMVKADEEGESECEESAEIIVGSSSQAGCSSRGDECDQDLETPESLRADAIKPIEEVMASYRVPNNHIHKLKSDTSKPASPYLRGRRGLNNGSTEGAAGASSAGCSSSSSQSTTDPVADSASNEEKTEDSNSRVIPIEKSDKDTSPGSLSEAGKSDSPGLVNGAVNGDVSEAGGSTGKRSKRISAGSASSENSTASVTPGTSPKKGRKLALDDLDDSTVVKNFITNDEIAEDDEEDSDDETFQPTEEPQDSDDEEDEHYSRTIAKHFLKCFDKAVRKSYDMDEDGDDDDESEADSTDEESSSAQSPYAADEAEESETDNHEVDESDEESAEDSDEDEDDMACEMMPTMGDEKPGIDSGCTAVVALLKGRDLYVANAGDSRCIVCRNGGQAVDMSEDHKPEDELERNRIEKAGGHVTGDGRVNGGLNLSRAIGDHCYKQKTDLPNTEQMITALPDVRTIKLEPDVEFLVLACDGIWNSLTSQEVVDFVRPRILENKSLSKICEELFDKCLAPNTWGDGTGCDNMTCIIVKLSLEDDETPPVESNAAEKTDSETNEVRAAGDTTACASTKSEKVVSAEASTAENGVVAEAVDTMKKSEVVSANGDGEPSDDSTSTSTTQSKAQKRSADKMVADDDHHKRQKTEDDTKVELS